MNTPFYFEHKTTTLVEESVAPGFNLYGTRLDHKARLIDRQGNTVHSWRFPRPYVGGWQHVLPLEQGRLLVVAKEKELLMLDWDSKPEWSLEGRFHHDAQLGPDGNFYTLRRHKHPISRDGKTFPILDGQIVVVTRDGKELKHLPLFPHVARFVRPNRFNRANHYYKKDPARVLRTDTPGDMLHANSIAILDHDTAWKRKDRHLYRSENWT